MGRRPAPVRALLGPPLAPKEVAVTTACMPRPLSLMARPDRDALQQRSVPRTLRGGQVLFLAGDRPRSVWGVEQGVLKLAVRTADGAETIVGLAVSGELVGEVPALDGLPQPFDAIACTPCRVRAYDADAFVAALGRNAAAATALSETMAARLRWTGASAAERSAATVPARLAGRLLDLADLLGRVEGRAVTVELPVSQGDLGRLAGMCRESACKTLRRFKAAGVVDYEGRRLRILRPDALERIRCAGRA